MKLRDLLALSGTRQEDLGERCRELSRRMGLPEKGYSQARISQIVAGRVKPRPHERRVIESVLHAGNLIEW